MATKLGGYTGKVLLVNLDKKITEEYPWTDEQRCLFIGGKIMAAKIINDNVGVDVDPLSPDNMIAITTGPFTCAGPPSSSRFNIFSKSPQTGYLSSSNCGGNFGYF